MAFVKGAVGGAFGKPASSSNPLVSSAASALAKIIPIKPATPSFGFKKPVTLAPAAPPLPSTVVRPISFGGKPIATSSQPAGTFSKNPIMQQFVAANPVVTKASKGVLAARAISTGFAKPTILKRLANAISSNPTAFAPPKVLTPLPGYRPEPVFTPTPPPSQGFPPDMTSGGSAAGGSSGGSGGSGGGYSGDTGFVPPGAEEDCEDDHEGDDNNSGGYSEYGGGDPADTFAHDQVAIQRTEALSPSDVDPHSPQSDYAPGPYSGNSYLEKHGTGNELDYTAGLGGFDNDDDESSGGQEMGSIVSQYAPSGAEESWNWRDRGRTPIPPFMYDAPRDRPGGEEGDDSMDAGDYISALNGFGDAAQDARDKWNAGGSLGTPSAGDFFTQFGKDVGVSAAQGALTNLSKALGGGTKKVDVLAPPPMSTAAKIAIAVAVGIPIVYILTRTKSAPAPLTVHNPRRRRARRRR